MARWEWQGGNLRTGRGYQAGRCWGQGEAAWMEEAGFEGNAAGVGEAGPGRGCQVGGGCRWRGGDGEVKENTEKGFGKTKFLLIGPDTTFIRK